jgi:hypothetical protein
MDFDNTTIRLAAPDPTFIRTLGKNKATGNLVTSDHQNFHVDRIDIAAHEFEACRGAGCPKG